jgi:excisionase family DNA binding protein
MAALSVDLPDEMIEALADAVASRLPAANGQKPDPVAAPGRLALTKAEAAEALGCSVDHLERHVLPDLRIVRSGRLRLIPMAELEKWLERNSARALEGAE